MQLRRSPATYWLGKVGTHCDDRALQVALAVQEATGIERILLFGSRARGDYKTESDIDLLIVHAQDGQTAEQCRQVARDAARQLYSGPIGTDVILVSPELFASVQFGLNHIAAKAVKDGVTPMGDSYPLPAGEAPRREPHQLEAMERVYHARVNFKTLERLMREGESTFYDSQDEFEMQFGNSAQSTLEHALKGLIASCREEFNRTHALDALKEHAESLILEFGGLQSPLAVLSAFAGGDIYMGHLIWNWTSRNCMSRWRRI